MFVHPDQEQNQTESATRSRSLSTRRDRLSEARRKTHERRRLPCKDLSQEYLIYSASHPIPFSSSRRKKERVGQVFKTFPSAHPQDTFRSLEVEKGRHHGTGKGFVLVCFFIKRSPHGKPGDERGRESSPSDVDVRTIEGKIEIVWM
ncbi:hypothetical protein [Phaffia rhodozyma]|uniref:Uncharacterized protein n=1 Tax=Phaffia rhodozyma TaxID=264483 RepID=A0A0F7SQD4_PHARH|nr:hypothetical protein [Phaffia rhodozyma]